MRVIRKRYLGVGLIIGVCLGFFVFFGIQEGFYKVLKAFLFAFSFAGLMYVGACLIFEDKDS